MAPAPGDFYYYFSLYKSLVLSTGRESDIFEGLDPSLTGLAVYPGQGAPFLKDRLQGVKDKVAEALERLRADDPLGLAPPLLEAISRLKETRERLGKEDLDPETLRALDRYLARKAGEFEAVLAQCLGLELEVLSERPRVIPGQRFKVSARLWNQRAIPLSDAGFQLSLPEGWQGQSPEPAAARGNTPGALTAAFDLTAPEAADLSCPYWLAQPRGPYAYSWPETDVAGRPFGPPPVGVDCQVTWEGRRLSLKRGAVYREAFPGGFRELPLAVIPPISLKPKSPREFLLVREADQHLELQVTVLNNNDEAVTGSLELVAPPGWEVSPGSLDLQLKESGDVTLIRHRLTIPAGAPAGPYPLNYKIRCGPRDYGVILTPVRLGAPGLPGSSDGSTCIKEEFLIAPSRVTAHLIDVKFAPGLSYAYVNGAEEELPEALKPLGVSFYQISDLELGHLDLGQFDAIVIGPNAYLIRGELQNYAPRFLDYVKEGGTLIVQYQGYGYQHLGAAPYPFSYSQPHDRVTDETAPVALLEPGHALFRLPNPVAEKDFENWIRERGLYFFGQWDKRYHPLLACADPGEAPQKGGLIECQYGRGTFLYTGYSFFRQLPEGVPGAFRLFANILALPAARLLERIEFLKKISLFSQMSEVQLDAVARIMAERYEDDGAFICRQGEIGDELFIVYQGEVEIVKTAKGREQVIFVAGPGDCIGELAVLGNIPRTASMRAKGDAHLLVINGAHFQSLLTQHPEMSLQVIKLLVNKLANSGR